MCVCLHLVPLHFSNRRWEYSQFGGLMSGLRRRDSLNGRRWLLFNDVLGGAAQEWLAHVLLSIFAYLCTPRAPLIIATCAQLRVIFTTRYSLRYYKKTLPARIRVKADTSFENNLKLWGLVSNYGVTREGPGKSLLSIPHVETTCFCFCVWRTLVKWNSCRLSLSVMVQPGFMCTAPFFFFFNHFIEGQARVAI